MYSRALLSSSKDERIEARYRLGQLYFSEEEKLRNTGKLITLSYGERVEEDIRLRALCSRAMAHSSSWGLLLSLGERELPKLRDQSSRELLDLMYRVAVFMNSGDAVPLRSSLSFSETEDARRAVVQLFRESDDFSARLGDEERILLRLIEQLLEKGLRSRSGLLYTALDQGILAPESPLAFDAVRQAGYGSRGERLYRLSRILEERNGRSYEICGFLARRTGFFSQGLEIYQRLMKEEAERAGASQSPSPRQQRLAWYRFDLQRSLDYRAAIEQLPELFPNILDLEYFDDLFGRLIDDILEDGDWNLLDSLCRRYAEDFGPDTAARLYYLSGRSRELGYLGSKKEAESYYQRVLELDPGAVTVRYYRILSAEALAYQPEELMPFLYPQRRSCSRDHRLPATGTSLLESLLDSGLAQEAEEILEFLEASGYSTGRELSIRLCRELSLQKQFLPALRRMERLLSCCGYEDEDELRLLYPRPYLESFNSISEKEGIDRELFLALVREESHFTPDIASHAGAVGLSQLMPSTAVDVASRMGLPRPRLEDLHNPQLNLSIGGWYLGHLESRTDSPAEALYSYNGGLTRVRRWRRSRPGLSGDLFPEFIPYPETQHYGRKLLVSFTIYRYLYASGDPLESAEYFFPDITKKENNR